MSLLRGWALLFPVRLGRAALTQAALCCCKHTGQAAPLAPTEASEVSLARALETLTLPLPPPPSLLLLPLSPLMGRGCKNPESLSWETVGEGL